MSLQGKKVLFFAAPVYEDLELWYPKIRLEEEGASTTVAGLGEPTYAGKHGCPVTVGKPVAFICHAGWVPISAKILKGKRATSVQAIKDDMENAGVIWEDSAVVVDRNLISSRTPADLPQFCKALIAALAQNPPD